MFILMAVAWRFCAFVYYCNLLSAFGDKDYPVSGLFIDLPAAFFHSSWHSIEVSQSPHICTLVKAKKQLYFLSKLKWAEFLCQVLDNIYRGSV